MTRRVLVIDDDPQIVRLCKAVLEERGDHVDVAANGKEALSKVVDGQPEIVILDLMMPELDGFEIVEALSSTGVTRPRIVIMTAKSLTPQEQTYLESRVERIIHKGIDDLGALLDEVMKNLEHRRARHDFGPQKP